MVIRIARNFPEAEGQNSKRNKKNNDVLCDCVFFKAE